jgi:hypothetical protein
MQFEHLGNNKPSILSSAETLVPQKKANTHTYIKYIFMTNFLLRCYSLLATCLLSKRHKNRIILTPKCRHETIRPCFTYPKNDMESNVERSK